MIGVGESPRARSYTLGLHGAIRRWKAGDVAPTSVVAVVCEGCVGGVATLVLWVVVVYQGLYACTRTSGEVASIVGRSQVGSDCSGSRAVSPAGARSVQRRSRAVWHAAHLLLHIRRRMQMHVHMHLHAHAHIHVHNRVSHLHIYSYKHLYTSTICGSNL